MKTGPYPLLFPKHFKQTVPATLSRTHSDYQIVPTLAKCIQPGDPIIEKDRYSAFFQTNLEIVLRARNIRSLIFSGVTTNVCVESTLRDAFYRDFFCFLLSDCTGTFTPELQKCSEDIISYVFGWVTTTKQIFRAVSRNQRVSNQS
jgi:ureidoacrylate peracid hydrolase